jgi:phage N-6-adenine-methyltransferase
MAGYMPDAKSDLWATPQRFFEECVEEFGAFDLDPAATIENAKCERFFTIEDDALSQEWVGSNVWLNPPYGRVLNQWVDKVILEFESGRSKRIVMLLPVRSSTQWFHKLYSRNDVEVRLLKGRMKFGDSKSTAPFPSCLIIIDSRRA